MRHPVGPCAGSGGDSGKVPCTDQYCAGCEHRRPEHMTVTREADGIRGSKDARQAPRGSRLLVSRFWHRTSPCAVPNRPLGLHFLFKDKENTKISKDSHLSPEKKCDMRRGGIAFDLQGSS